MLVDYRVNYTAGPQSGAEEQHDLRTPTTFNIDSRHSGNEIKTIPALKKGPARASQQIIEDQRLPPLCTWTVSQSAAADLGSRTVASLAVCAA